MALPIRSLSAAVAAALLTPLAAPGGSDPPDRPAPPGVQKPATRQELDHAEAVALYGLGVAREHESRLVDALKQFEAARQLDPDAPAPHRALARLYLALDRPGDARAAAERTLALDPDDYETGHLYARLLRARGLRAEATGVLRRAAAVPELKEHPEARGPLCSDLAALCEESGDWSGAEAALRQVVEVLNRPEALEEAANLTREDVEAQAAETYERLGRACLKGGHTDRASAAFAAAGARDPARAARLAYNLAEVYAAGGRDAEALARVEEYLRSQPQKIDGYELRATLLRKMGRPGEVLPGLEASASRDKHNRALGLLLAREYQKAGRRTDAEGVYERLASPEEGPGAEVFRGLFELYRADGPDGAGRALRLFDGAVKEASAGENKGQPPAVGVQGGNAPALFAALRADKQLAAWVADAAARPRPGGPLHPNTRYVLAMLADQAGRAETAEALYRSCLDQPGGPGDLESAAYSGLLDVLQKSHRHEAVVTACKQGLERAKDTNRILFLYDLSRAQAALGRGREAIEAADEAVRAADARTRLACAVNRVGVLTEVGRAGEAVAACLALLKEYNKADEMLKVRMALSSAYTAAGEPDKAEAELEAVLKENPANATANNDLGYLWADRNKNLEGAERLVRKAIELERGDRASGEPGEGDGAAAAYLDSLGWVLFRRGDLAGARKELERAASLPGGADDPVVWDHLGDVRSRQGEKAAAAECWRKALGLYELGVRRRGDGRYDEIKGKLRQTTSDE